MYPPSKPVGRLGLPSGLAEVLGESEWVRVPSFGRLNNSVLSGDLVEVQLYYTASAINPCNGPARLGRVGAEIAIRAGITGVWQIGANIRIGIIVVISEFRICVRWRSAIAAILPLESHINSKQKRRACLVINQRCEIG